MKKVKKKKGLAPLTKHKIANLNTITGGNEKEGDTIDRTKVTETLLPPDIE